MLFYAIVLIMLFYAIVLIMIILWRTLKTSLHSSVGLRPRSHISRYLIFKKRRSWFFLRFSFRPYIKAVSGRFSKTRSLELNCLKTPAALLRKFSNPMKSHIIYYKHYGCSVRDAMVFCSSVFMWTGEYD